MIEIKVLQAYRGDCIWVRCLEESENINIIIDSGTATFKNEFKNLVEEIENNKERILSLIHISEPTRPYRKSRMPSSA